ncbi:MAG TPA: exodeoxyribonuclease VII large subunit [Fulvivirga sp.]|nr:exodeoxyribonuclease VII large subunit [Fulvivirga sp.]
MEHLTLFQLNKLVQKTLDTQLNPSYWVIAEIGEMRVNQNGHCYLELVEKEENSIIAKSRATIWANNYRNLSLWFEKMTGQPLKNGLKILCNVVIQFHEVYGLSYNIRDIDANFTLGERARKRQEVIDSLIEEGVFEMNRQLPLPIILRKIAVISSPGAAGYEDFMDQLQNNRYGYQYEATLFKATMQGDQAAESIINALLAAHNSQQEFDVVVIIRGGGSQIDLDCFDDFELVSHACQLPIPIITGIGHERDESILDMVANMAHKTPTAVAEWIVNLTMEYESRILTVFQDLSKAAQNQFKQIKNQLDQMQFRLKNGLKSSLVAQQYLLKTLKSRLIYESKKNIEKHQKALELKANKVDFLDPANILKRGYSITSINGKIVTNTNIQVGDLIETSTHTIKLTSKVESID